MDFFFAPLLAGELYDLAVHVGRGAVIAGTTGNRFVLTNRINALAIGKPVYLSSHSNRVRAVSAMFWFSVQHNKMLTRSNQNELAARSVGYCPNKNNPKSIGWTDGWLAGAHEHALPHSRLAQGSVPAHVEHVARRISIELVARRCQ